MKAINVCVFLSDDDKGQSDSEETTVVPSSIRQKTSSRVKGSVFSYIYWSLSNIFTDLLRKLKVPEKKSLTVSHFLTNSQIFRFVVNYCFSCHGNNSLLSCLTGSPYTSSYLVMHSFLFCITTCISFEIREVCIGYLMCYM